MKAILLTVMAVGLTACVSTSGDTSTSAPVSKDARYNALYSMPVTQFYANVRLAAEIGASCSGFQRDSRVDFEINEQRNKAGRGSYSALRQRKQIDVQSAALKAQFLGRYGTLCAGASREYAAKTSPMSYLLKSG